MEGCLQGLGLEDSIVKISESWKVGDSSGFIEDLQNIHINKCIDKKNVSIIY